MRREGAIALGVGIVVALTLGVVIALATDSIRGGEPEGIETSPVEREDAASRGRSRDAAPREAPGTPAERIAFARRSLYQRLGQRQRLERLVREARQRRDRDALERHQESLEQTKRQIGDLERQLEALERTLPETSQDAAALSGDDAG